MLAGEGLTTRRLRSSSPRGRAPPVFQCHSALLAFPPTMFLARASVAAGPRIARQRLVVLLSSSRSLASFVPASRPVAWGVRSAPTVACSLGSNPGRSERHFSAQWPGLRPKDGQRRVVDDRIYVGNLPMGFTEDGSFALCRSPTRAWPLPEGSLRGMTG